MGGTAGGKLASDLAASMFLADFRREMQAGIAVEPAMRHACDAANRAVYDRACADPDLHGMGTTIVAACVRHGRLTVLHVGDSRAYLACLRRMQQLTTDHSLVQELVASGQVLPEQAHRHPRRNVITRAVGVGPKVEPDWPHAAVSAGGTTAAVYGRTVQHAHGGPDARSLPQLAG